MMPESIPINLDWLKYFRFHKSFWEREILFTWIFRKDIDNMKVYLAYTDSCLMRNHFHVHICVTGLFRGLKEEGLEFWKMSKKTESTDTHTHKMEFWMAGQKVNWYNFEKDL